MREASQDVKQGLLATAGRTDDADKLAFLDFKGYPAQGLHIDFADAIGFAHVFCLNHPRHVESLILHEAEWMPDGPSPL